MIWRLFNKSVHVKPICAHGPTVDETVIKWGVFEGREYTHLRDDFHRYGWRVALSNLLVVLGVPAQWLGAKVEEIEE